MPNYLTKEEIRQWRSSLEKITLEEFAARLGKEVEECKATNDVVDIVMSKGTSSNTTFKYDSFSLIAERAFARERQISHTPFSISKRNSTKKRKPNRLTGNKSNSKVKTDNSEPRLNNSSDMAVAKNEQEVKSIQIVLKRALTDREQMVLDYLVNNVGKTVFAKDLAVLLDLPRDYVYKYIKNLRAKIEGDRLKNVPSGGFILTE